jgi:hypothetical protein
MPELAEIFSHVVVDVSSISALCIRWYPKGEKLYNNSSMINLSLVLVHNLSRDEKHGHNCLLVIWPLYIFDSF